MPLNAHRVFAGSPEKESYLSQLNLDQPTETSLRGARDEIREALRAGLRDWPALISESELFGRAIHVPEPVRLKPKFRMQGSFAYHTCNDPAQTPPQEVDLDDGLFLPVSFLTQNGVVHPSVASKGLFLAVERILGKLSHRKGWALVTDKPSCVRIKISKDAHVDIALYAIPDGEFVTLVEAAAASHSGTPESRLALLQALQDSLELDENLYQGLRHEQIMLAHREDGWKPSDPRKLEDWFHDAIREHGEQLRRVSRYLKGWRDFQWLSCHLASIALMAGVVTAYREGKGQTPDNRDDQALLMVAEKLSAILQSRIPNPVVEGQYLDEGWSADERADFSSKAKNLFVALRGSLLGTTDPEKAIATLTAIFGDRIPDDPELISTEPSAAPERKSALSTPSVFIPAGPEAIRRGELAAHDLGIKGAESKPWRDSYR